MRKALVLVVLLTACGGGGEDEATSTTTTGAVRTTTTTAATDPVQAALEDWYAVEPVDVVNACFALDLAQQGVDLGDPPQEAFTTWLLDRDVPGNVTSVIDNSSDAASTASMAALLEGCAATT